MHIEIQNISSELGDLFHSYCWTRKSTFWLEVVRVPGRLWHYSSYQIGHAGGLCIATQTGKASNYNSVWWDRLI